MRESACRFTITMKAAGAPRSKWVGCIAGTSLLISRPREGLLRMCHGDHKHKDALKFQSVLNQEDIFVQMCECVEGRRLALTLYHESGWDVTLAVQQEMYGEPLFNYSGSGFLERPWKKKSCDVITSLNEAASPSRQRRSVARPRLVPLVASPRRRSR